MYCFRVNIGMSNRNLKKEKKNPFEYEIHSENEMFYNTQSKKNEFFMVVSTRKIIISFSQSVFIRWIDRRNKNEVSIIHTQ